MIKIIKGSDQPIKVQFYIQESNCTDSKFLDLTNTSEIVAKFRAQDGSILSLKLSDSKISIVSQLTGLISINFAIADTLLLREGNCESMEIELTIDSKVYIYQFEDELIVKGSVFN